MNYPTKVRSLITMGANLYPDKNAVQKKFLKEYKWALRYAKILTLLKPTRWRSKVIVRSKLMVGLYADERQTIKNIHSLTYTVR